MHSQRGFGFLPLRLYQLFTNRLMNLWILYLLISKTKLLQSHLKMTTLVDMLCHYDLASSSLFEFLHNQVKGQVWMGMIELGNPSTMAVISWTRGE